MAILDDFTDTAGTNLTAHTPSGGGSWSKHPASGAANIVISDANRARLNAGGSQAIYIHSHAPASADYTAKADFHFVTVLNPQFPTLLARMDATADTGYMAQYNAGAGGWQLKRRVTGTDTQLGTTFSDTPGSGVTRAVALDVQGDQVTITIDGVARCGSPVTDANISGAGKVGLIDFVNTTPPANSTGCHFDNVEIVESGGGGGSSIAVLMRYYRQMEAENAAG